jgi:hypothetical protein
VGPKIEIYRDVQIRYGYNVVDDRYYAHFDLPEKRLVDNDGGAHSRTFTYNGLGAGKQRPKSASSSDEVLKQVRSTIDSYLDE